MTTRSPAAPEVSRADRAAPGDAPGWIAARPLGVLMSIVSVVGVVQGSLWWLVAPQAQFLALGWAAGLVVSLPFLQRNASLHSPWFLVAFSVYVGCSVRGTFIALGIDGEYHSIDRLFLLGQPPSYFLAPSLLHLGGLVLLTAGYAAGTTRWRRRGRRGATTSPRPAGRRLGPSTPVICAVFALVGFVAFVLYARQTGGLGLGSLSAKRTTINGLDLADDYSSHGELRFLNGFSAAAFWVAIAWFAIERRAGRPHPASGAALAVLGLNAILLPFYASSRSEAGFILLVALALHTAFGARFSRRALTVGGVALLVLLGTMTTLRAASSGARSDEQVSVVGSISESFVYNRNFGDMQNTSHIVHNVPRVVPFQNGATMAAYMLGPIPRSLWPEKPIVNTGPLIGVYIYGSARSGVPPGLFGDLYLNFGAPAVLGGGLLVGLGLSLVERWRRGVDLAVPIGMIFYCTVGFRMGLYSMNKGAAFAFFKAAMDLLPVLVVVALSVRLSDHPVGRRRGAPARRVRG